MSDVVNEQNLVKLLLKALPGYERRLRQIKEEMAKLAKEKEVTERKIEEMRRDLEYYRQKGVDIEAVKKQLEKEEKSRRIRHTFL